MAVKCRDCHRIIKPGMEHDKRVECRRLEDDSEALYGAGLPDAIGKVPAGSALIWAKHAKCYWITARRIARGQDPATGSALATAALAEGEDD